MFYFLFHLRGFQIILCREKTEKLSVLKFILFLSFSDDIICLRGGGFCVFVLDPHFKDIQNYSKKKSIWLVQKAHSFSAATKG